THRLTPSLFPSTTLFRSLVQRQHAYGYSAEDLKAIITPMATSGYEPVGSMGDDTPLAVLSKESRHISNYFKQHFAQVSNPPIDRSEEHTSELQSRENLVC